MLCEIPRRHLFYALLLGGISVVLSAAAANMIQHYYQVAANPRVAGRIERTWIVTGKHNSHTRVRRRSLYRERHGRAHRLPR